MSIYKTAPRRMEGDIPVFSHDSRYTTNYEKIAHDHLAAQKPGEDNPFMANDLWEELENSTRALVTRHVAPGGKVLDAGVGLGRVMAPLSQYERYGIDISFEYLTQARSQGIDVAWALIEDMPYHDASFDAVIACDVLEHVLDFHACMTQILRVLKPGGHLIIRVPYRDDLEVYLNDDMPYEFIHLRSFDVPQLRLQLQKIFGCDYIEHNLQSPRLRGPERMYLRPLKSTSPLHKLLSEHNKQGLFRKSSDPLDFLRRALSVNEEEMINWIYDLERTHPELFARILPHLVIPLEVNIVFRKPYR